ncbi:ABC-2 type transport system permease protein [Arcanobacterium pluranimalium]|uniref:ABC transporter permease n=1 Tax=Arcanobacterium pluranimalium TaxID=108028 RepID=UPI00195B0859|nr:ABC transporter permease [Arcanobacterium pluranimalium]MBM7824777.1 ABC-2 type transport system permease protein [Arcanobacterium pluranimalium]
MTVLKHIIKREFSVLAGAKAQRIGTIVTVIIILAAGIVGGIIKDRSQNDSAADQPAATFSVAITEQMEPYQPTLEGTGAVQVESIKAAEAEDWLKKQVASKSAPASAVLTGTPADPEIIQSKDQDKASNQAITQLISQVVVMTTTDRVAGPLSVDAQKQIAKAFTPKITTIAGEKMNLMESNPIGYFTGVITQMLLFFAVITGLSTISIGVVEEKSSRVVEILLSAVRPRTLLLGKILGIGSFVLVQMVIYIAAGIVSLNIAGMWANLNVGSTIGWLLAWLLIGFFTFTTIAGALAATVSRQEDLGAITGPFTFFMLIPFYLGIFLVPAQPTSLLTQVLSFIPGFTPFIMPIRQAYGVVGVGEALAAMAVGVVAIYLLSLLAGRIYSNSVLHMGKRLKLSEALRGKK